MYSLSIYKSESSLWPNIFKGNKAETDRTHRTDTLLSLMVCVFSGDTVFTAHVFYTRKPLERCLKAFSAILSVRLIKPEEREISVSFQPYIPSDRIGYQNHCHTKLRLITSTRAPVSESELTEENSLCVRYGSIGIVIYYVFNWLIG